MFGDMADLWHYYLIMLFSDVEQWPICHIY
jgi:hypothetical protein